MLTTIKGEIDNNIVTVKELNASLIRMERSTGEKINKETQTVNDTLDMMILIDIYRTYHPKQKNTHFSQVHIEYSPG